MIKLAGVRNSTFFKEVFTELKNDSSSYRYGEKVINGEYHFYIYKMVNGKEIIIYQAEGIKDVMVLIQMYEELGTLISKSLNKETVGNKWDGLLECLESCYNTCDYSFLPFSSGLVRDFTEDDEDNKKVLISFDNNCVDKCTFYINFHNDGNPKVVNLKRPKNYLSKVMKCWDFVDSIKGQSRINITMSFAELQNFTKFEALYILFLLQFSAKTWVKQMLKDMFNENVKYYN